MAQNYYSLKREADDVIRSGLKFLQTQPEQSCISLVHMALQFQTLFGFNKKMLERMLEPYLETKQAMIIDGNIYLFKEVKKDGINPGITGQPADSSPSPKP